MVEVNSRAGGWACLERQFYWTAELTRARLCTIVEELRAVLMRSHEGRFYEPPQTQAEAVAPAASTGEGHDHL